MFTLIWATLLLPPDKISQIMRQIIVFTFLSLYSCLSLSAGCFENTLWDQCREAKDIEICSAKFGKSETLAFRGKAKIKAPLKQLVSVFYDVEHYNDWQINVKDIKVVRDIVPPGKNACAVERIEHSFGKKPWLVRWAFWVPDSDFVYKASYNLSPDAKHFALYLENDESKDVPEEKKYRRGTVQSCYVLDSSEDTNETLIRAEIWVDLKLDISPSRINSNLRDWPIDLINGLRKHVVNPDLKKDVTGADQFIDHCLESDTVNLGVRLN